MSSFSINLSPSHFCVTCNICKVNFLISEAKTILVGNASCATIPKWRRSGAVNVKKKQKTMKKKMLYLVTKKLL